MRSRGRLFVVLATMRGHFARCFHPSSGSTMSSGHVYNFAAAAIAQNSASSPIGSRCRNRRIVTVDDATVVASTEHTSARA